VIIKKQRNNPLSLSLSLSRVYFSSAMDVWGRERRNKRAIEVAKLSYRRSSRGGGRRRRKAIFTLVFFRLLSAFFIISAFYQLSFFPFFSLLQHSSSPGMFVESSS
jgi:hypothetical protein